MRNLRFRYPSVPKTVAWRVVRAIALIGLVNFVLFVGGAF